MIVSELKTSEPGTSRHSNPPSSADFDLIFEEVQHMQDSMSQIITAISKIQNTQLSHSLKLDDNQESLKRLKDIQSAVTALPFAVGDIQKNRGIMSSLTATQELITNRVNSVESLVSRKIELLQVTMSTAIENMSSSVTVLSSHVRKLSDKMEQFDKKGEE